MRKNFKNIVCVMCHALICFTTLVKGYKDEERKPYIVYMGELQEIKGEIVSGVDEHHSILSDVVGSEKLAKKSRIHSYGKSFNGFVAHLLPHEADKLKGKKNVISVFEDEIIKPMTTRSWDNVGMPLTVKRNLQVESDTIIAIFDTGIYVESPSFDDKGFGPPPKKWKGTCQKGDNFIACNNKVIGAQYINMLNSSQDAALMNSPPGKDLANTPADNDGHGTMCASVAAGNAVPLANLFGYGEGTTRGAVPSARLAIYRICTTGCLAMNLLAAFDKAISDGVDVISISQGFESIKNYFEDVFSIGAFHALKKGISTICAAGNEGPNLYTVKNVAPWITTVGAIGFERDIQTLVKLGNGKVYYGRSINPIKPEKEMYPLTNGVLAKNTNQSNDSSACNPGTLSEEKVKGSIVLCQGWNKGSTIRDMQGAGIITVNEWLGDTSYTMKLPGVNVNKRDGEAINQYINSNKSPMAVIYKSVTINRTTPIPFVGSFSSRGPNQINSNILKPDIVAPGVNILSPWSALKTITAPFPGNTSSMYYIVSGTSVAAPHVAGASAYVKTFHIEWSPAAIKSALLTTATSINEKPVEGALASGAGVINPTEALNPGLVYDIDFDSYIGFLCKEGFNITTLSILTGNNSYDCSKSKPAKGADGLNYPTMYLQLQKQNSSGFSATFYRDVTNVGEGVSLYKANIESPKELSISVVPKMLSFTKSNQKLSFKVDVNGKFESNTSSILEASLVWSDSSNHNVRSPILVYRDTTSSQR